MMFRNKILANIYLEEGCSQDEGEVSQSWSPINFSIYSPLFVDLIDEAISQWLSEHRLVVGNETEVIFEHVVERDGAGAVTGEYFQPIWFETAISVR